MEQKPKKAVLAAISAAVTTYIRTQEEAFAAVATAAAATAPAAAAAGSFYGAYGRQQMMEMRHWCPLIHLGIHKGNIVAYAGKMPEIIQNKT